jgi:membrane-associated protein
MEFLTSLVHFDLKTLIITIGYVGLLAIVFAESGLFFGFFLPGDSLLFTAGLLASQGTFHIGVLLTLIPIAAILGDNVGYWFGAKVGHAWFTRDDSLFFKKKHVARTHAFYEKYGSRALILGRFVPIVRTFVPILAGVGEMDYAHFLRYNIIGGVVWGVGVTSAGYFLGASIPNIDHYLLPITLGIIVLSFLPIVIEVYRERKARRAAAQITSS